MIAQLSQIMGGDEKPMNFVLEEWPGGRWFRDLGNGQGHFWGLCPGDQAADAARDHGADDDVVPGRRALAVSIALRSPAARCSPCVTARLG